MRAAAYKCAPNVGTPRRASSKYLHHNHTSTYNNRHTPHVTWDQRRVLTSRGTLGATRPNVLPNTRPTTHTHTHTVSTVSPLGNTRHVPRDDWWAAAVARTAPTQHSQWRLVETTLHRSLQTRPKYQHHWDCCCSSSSSSSFSSSLTCSWKAAKRTAMASVHGHDPSNIDRRAYNHHC